MEKFVFYFKGKDGVVWYRCTNCGYLTRGKPDVCPVCQGNVIKRCEDVIPAPKDGESP